MVTEEEFMEQRTHVRRQSDRDEEARVAAKQTEQLRETLVQEFKLTLYAFGRQDSLMDIPARGHLLSGWKREEYLRGYRYGTAEQVIND